MTSSVPPGERSADAGAPAPRSPQMFVRDAAYITEGSSPRLVAREKAKVVLIELNETGSVYSWKSIEVTPDAARAFAFRLIRLANSVKRRAHEGVAAQVAQPIREEQ